MVLDQQSIPTGYIAVRRVVRSHGHAADEPALRGLVRNEAQIAGDASEIFKVWPTDRDRDGFRAVMGEDEVSGQEDSPPVKAHGFDHIVRIWPRPEQEGPGTAVVAENTALGEGRGAADRDTTAVDHHGKYRELWRWLKGQDGNRLPMGFAQVAEAAGVPLPDSAYNHSPHWYSYEGSALCRAVHDAGWRATKVNLDARTVCFVRSDPQE